MTPFFLKVRNSVEALTVEQWKKIDLEYREKAEIDLKGVAVFITAAIVLILQRYFGKSDFITGVAWARTFSKSLPFPDIYPNLYWACFNMVNYFLLPAIVVKVVLGERIRDYGFKITRDRRVLFLYIAMIAVVLPVAWIVSHNPSFMSKYPFYRNAGDSLGQLLLWEGAYGFQFLMLEFFFRGFLLFALARYIGSYAIFVMVIPYTMVHFGKPIPETFGAVVAGTALGTIALRTRSIYGGFIVHATIAWSMDLFSLANRGILQKLF